MRRFAEQLASLAFVLTLAAPPVSSDPAEVLELEALMQRMAASAGVIANFREQKEIALLSLPLESRGVLYFAPPGRLARFTREPSYSSLVIDGELLRFRDRKDGEEFDLSGDPMARVFVDNFVVLFNGDLETLRKLYQIELSGGLENWTLELVPRRAPLDHVMKVITLRGGERGIVSMEMLGTDGDRSTTELSQVDADRSFTEAELKTLFSDRVPLAQGAAEH